jgi:hypothetical protein
MPAGAEVLNYNFPLEPTQEVQNDPVISSAFGTGIVTLDTTLNNLSWNIEFSGLTSSVSAAHFHGREHPFDDVSVGRASRSGGTGAGHLGIAGHRRVGSSPPKTATMNL